MNLPEAIDTFLVNKALDIQQQYQQKLTDPTTIRYSSYAGHLLSFNGVLPNPFPLLLKSVICSIKSTLVLSDSNTILISNKASSTHYLNQIIHHDVSLTLNHATFAFNAGFVLPGSFQVLDHMISNAPNGFDFHITFEAIDTSLLRPYSYKRFFSKIDIKQSLLRLSKVYPVDNSNVHDICKVFPISFEFAVFCLFHYNQYASDFIKDLLPKLSPNVLDSITNRVSIQQRTSSTSLPRSISETSSYITRSVSDSRIEEINQRYETKQDIIPVSDNRDSNSSSRVSLEEDYYHKTTQLKQDRIKSKTELENTLDSLRNRQTESKIKSPSPILRKSPSPRNKSVKTSKLLNQFGDLLNELDSIDTVNNDGLDVADNEVLSLWGLVVNEMTNEDIHSGKHNPNLQQKAESIVPSAPMNPSSMKTFQDVFSAPVPSSTPTISKYTNLIDIKRANNVSICASRYTRNGISAMALCVAIKEFNERLLSLDDLSTLHVLIPTIQEREILLGYSRNKKKIDGKPLAPAESFLLQMCKEPDIDMMLNAFKFKCMFNNELNDIESICERITKICLLIKQGMKFKILLSIFITFKDTTNEIFSNGNNGFKPWMGKDARQLGLKISNLSKIKDIKSNDNEWSLMIYLIDLIKKQGNDVLNIGHDFIDLTMICQFETIDLMNQLKSIEMLFIEISNYEFRDEDFTDLISPYLKVAELRINETTSTLMKIDDLFAETVAYLGEDLNEYHGLFEEENARKRLHPMDLFRMLDVFFVSFREAVESTRPKEVVERRRGSGAQSDTDDEN